MIGSDPNTMAMVDVLGDPRCGVHFDEANFRFVFLAPSSSHPGSCRIVASMAADLYVQDRKQMAKLREVAMGILIEELPLPESDQ